MNQRSFSEKFQAGHFTWLLLALILAANFFIRWHLRSMPLERDEGEYAYAGQLLLQGVPPYEAAYNMKFPGTYFAYAVLMAVFGQTPEGIHIGIIVITSLNIVLMFFIGKNLLGDWGGLMTAAIFGAMSALPWTFGLAGHATHFVVLFVCAGTLCLLLTKDKFSRTGWFVSGLALGMAVLMKQHAAIFCVAGGAWLLTQHWRSKSSWIAPLTLFSAGVALPLMLTAAMLMHWGVWDRFVFWTIDYARQYVSILSLHAVPSQIEDNFGRIFFSAMWPWVLGAAALTMIFFKTERRRAALVGAGLLLAGLVAVCPGFYFRGHYFLMVMPGLALLVSTGLLGLAVWLKKSRQIPQLRFLPACLFFVLLGEMLLRNGEEWFLLSPGQVCRQIYGVNPFPEAAVVAGYIAAHSAPADTVAVLGSEPQLFFLAHRRSATGYIYVYPLTENQPLAPRMRGEFMREIETARPEFVVYDNTMASWCSTLTPGKTEFAMEQVDNWWNSFAANYTIVGEADIHEDAPTDFFWEDNLGSRTETNRASLYILRRK